MVGSVMAGVQNSESVYAVKKSQDVMEMEGQMAVKLIQQAGNITAQTQSVKNPAGTGENINSYV